MRATRGAPRPGHDPPRRGHRVHRRVRRPEDRSEAGAPTGDQRALLLRAVVERRVRQHDVPDAERAQPGEVAGAVELGVEDVVAREVVLPEPASRDRDPGGRQVGGGPVADGVDRLDAVRRREIARWRNAIAGAQYAGSAAGSPLVLTKLPASGVRFQATASARANRREPAAGASAAARASGSRSGSPRTAAARCSRRARTERDRPPCRRRGRRRTSSGARPPPSRAT